MKKFNTIILENIKNIEYDINQLKIGIEIEKEHLDVYNYFKEYLNRFNIEMPCSEEELYTIIAKAHLRENPKYYQYLIDMEDKMKKD